MRALLIGAAIAALAALIGAAGWTVYREGKAAGKAECQAERAENANQAQAAINDRDQRSAANNASMIDWLAANVPPIQARADESAATVVVKYRDRIVRVGDDSCSRPASVQADLDAARARANGTGAALQARPNAASTARTAPTEPR